MKKSYGKTRFIILLSVSFASMIQSMDFLQRHSSKITPLAFSTIALATGWQSYKAYQEENTLFNQTFTHDEIRALYRKLEQQNNPAIYRVGEKAHYAINWQAIYRDEVANEQTRNRLMALNNAAYLWKMAAIVSGCIAAFSCADLLDQSRRQKMSQAAFENRYVTALLRGDIPTVKKILKVYPQFAYMPLHPKDAVSDKTSLQIIWNTSLSFKTKQELSEIMLNHGASSTDLPTLKRDTLYLNTQELEEFQWLMSKGVKDDQNDLKDLALNQKEYWLEKNTEKAQKAQFIIDALAFYENGDKKSFTSY